jgi:gamma-glutamyl-gamma-aminobutyraldehyde dehydrogenase
MKFLEYSAQSNGKRVWLELGGKTASLVLEDADFEAAVRATAAGCFYNQGQMCTAASRLLVPISRLAEAREIAARVAIESQPADPLELYAQQGAIVSQTQLQRIAGFVSRAVTDGAELAAGSELPAEPTEGGSYFAPAVLANVDPDSEIAQNEVFGPVLAIIGYADLEDGIRIANSTRYGLAASIWTKDLSLAHRVSRRIQSGVVWINCFEEGDMTLPFGGVKQSGYGRDKSLHAIDKFTNLKATWIQL